MTIYGAGYFRTKAAAEKLDAAQRRMPVPLGSQETLATVPTLRPAPPVVSADAGKPGAPVDPPKTTLAMPTVPAASPREVPDARTSAELPGPATPATSSTTVSPRTSAARTQPSANAAAAVVADPATVAAAASTPPPAATDPVSSVASTAGVAAAAPAAPAAPTPPAKSLYKDGSYSGWGTSRHGDIEATVTIEGGRITKAVISQCLTRYSCNWIDPLPPQVVQRQNAEVDTVSGATQSTYAFYYALVEALTKAK
ncbi:MAG: FMN-binding protein [Vicinamibacterales bacterium]